MSTSDTYVTQLKIEIQPDSIVQDLCERNGYHFDGTTVFDVPSFQIPSDYGIGLIVGPSGTGKSTILNSLSPRATLEWEPSTAICSHFETAEEASQRLSAVGLNSVPVWVKPFHVLSTGEKFRATMARSLVDGATIDEFTSVVDRTVAKSCAFAIRRFVDKENLRGITFASCHYDIIEWLQPDWVYDTHKKQLTVGRESLERPQIKIELYPSSSRAWNHFKDHHYLTGELHQSSRCWIATWDDVLVGFSAAIAYPSGTIQNGWREHRTVVLPEFQGLGLGVRISDAVAKIFVEDGCRYFSKTAHPRMGEYRENSPHWRPTSHNKKDREDYKTDKNIDNKRYSKRSLLLHHHRVCYCHEYIGG